jgi:hypothetical protein
MSKRHHSSRRRAYGRRQHELHERFDRRRNEQADLPRHDDSDGVSPTDSFAFLDPRTPRLRFVLGD